MSQARAYESPLREEQMEQTRLRILEAVTDLFVDDSTEELTIPRVAERARVSIRTVYRYFPTREALFDAWGDWIDETIKVQLHSYPETLEEFLEFTPRLYRSYDENESLVRAMLTGKAARNVRTRTRRRRQQAFERALLDVTSNLEPDERRRVTAVIYLLSSAPAWNAMRDQWGLDGEEAGKAAAWAIRVLVDALRQKPESRSEGGER
jgi:AcrR family transcriptional regulator